MVIERTTIEEMRCSMGGCSNTVRDLGMREGEGVYTIEEIAIDAGWKIEEFNGGVIHICPRCSSDYDALRAELARVKAESLRVVADGEACQPQDLYPTQFVLRDGRVWVNHPGTRDIVDITNNNRVAVPYDVTVQPVRLERWEDE